MNPNRPFLIFLRRAHRRRLQWRLIKHAVLALLCGCAIAVVVLPILWWHRDDAVPPTVALLAVSVVAGVVWAQRRRPSLLDTAQVVETRLSAPELLSSALS